MEGMQNLAPQLFLPALAKSLSPVQKMLLMRQQEIMDTTNKQINQEERRQNALSLVAKNSSKCQVDDSHSETKVKQKQLKTKATEGNKVKLFYIQRIHFFHGLVLRLIYFPNCLLVVDLEFILDFKCLY